MDAKLWDEVKVILFGLNGNFPLLSDSHTSLVKDVYEEAYDHFRTSAPPVFQYNCSDCNYRATGEKPKIGIETIAIALKKLVSIIHNLKQCYRANERFITKFPDWKRIRDNNIKKLRELADSLNSNKKVCNYVRLGGSTGSLVGGITCLVSAALIPFSFGLSTPLLIAGGATTLVGSATAAGSSITELVLLRSRVEEAKTIIKEDRDKCEDLNIWLVHSRELSDALDSFLEIDVVKDIICAIEDLVHDIVKNIRTGDRKILIQKLVRTFSSYIPESFSFPATLIGLLFAIMLLRIFNKCTNIIFDCASLVVKGGVTVYSFLDTTADGASAIARLIPGNAAIGKSVGTVVARGTLAAIGIAFDIVSVVLTSIDVHQGSLSAESTKIMNITENLEEEVKVLQMVYNRIEYNTHGRDLTNKWYIMH